jgi:hypothetical protein
MCGAGKRLSINTNVAEGTTLSPVVQIPTGRSYDDRYSDSVGRRMVPNELTTLTRPALALPKCDQLGYDVTGIEYGVEYCEYIFFLMANVFTDFIIIILRFGLWQLR